MKVGDKIKHFKGGEYEIIAFAKDSDSLEDLVIYQSIEDSSKVWSRPLKEFDEEVDRPEYNYKGPRFIQNGTSN